MEFLKITVVFAWLAITTKGSPVASPDAPRWCCKSADELNKCETLNNRKDDDGDQLFPFRCVQAESTLGCIDKIVADECDIMALDAGDIFAHQSKLSIVAAEDNGVEDASYYAVAVVKKNSVPGLNLHKIAGYTTCHTGVGKTAGWNMPMGWFIRHGINASDIRASCAPGSYDDKYAKQMQQQRLGCPDKWCALCKGDGQGRNVCDRDNDESYYGYSGALECLKDVGNVAFVKHSTVSKEEQDDFELLCPDATRASMSDWSYCNLGRVPSHAIVMHARTTTDEKKDVLSALRNAKANNKDFNTFGGDDLLWSSSVTTFLDRINQSVQEYLGTDYMCNLDAISTGRSSSACKVY